MLRLMRFSAICAALILSSGPLRASELFVSPSGTGIGSMTDPMALQAALTYAATNNQDDTLYLQQGTYSAAATFTYEITGAEGDADRDLTISGGWSAGFAAQSDDPSLTVLTGESARRVLYIDARTPGRTADVFLKNLTLCNGNTTYHGGGILGQTETGASGSYGQLNLSLDNCVLTGNVADDANTGANDIHGGAIHLEGGLTATGCVFADNHAEFTGAVSMVIPGWSAASNHSWSRPASFTDCEFRDNYNTSPNNGPAVMRIVGNTLTMEGCLVHRTSATSAGLTETLLTLESAVKLTNCQFRNNIVDMYASAIDLLGSSAEITNCLFENNQAGVGGVQGGGVITGWNYEGNGWPANPSETVTVTNCTFVGNKGYIAGGYSSVLDLQPPQEARFTNCIFRGNDVPAVRPWYGVVSLAYSALDGNIAGNNFQDFGNNTNQDPLFVVGDDEYHLQAGSPCVDTGDASAVPAYLTTDFEGQPRIFGAGDPAVKKVDMGRDEYYNGVLQFTAPPVGTFWLNDGTAKTITWTCTNIPGNVRLYLWQGPRFGGHEVPESLDTQVPCADGSYSWTPPADLPEADDYAVAMDSLVYPTVGHGVGPISIRHMHLTAPNGGQIWRQGSFQTIRWVSSVVGGTVKIELLRGGTPLKVIASAAPNSGSFRWKVPYTIAPACCYRIRISTESPSYEDESDADFRITPALWVTAPNGGQAWKRGTSHAITWRYSGNPGTQVRIDLYKGHAFKRNLIPATTIGSGGTGSWLWAIPPTLPVATDYTVRIRSTSNINCFDFSNAFFKVTR